MAGPLKGPLSALRVGAVLLAGALKLGSAALGGLAHVFEEVSGAGREGAFRENAEAAIATPAGVVAAREGTPVAPEGFYPDPAHRGQALGVEDVLDVRPPPGAPPGPRETPPQAPAAAPRAADGSRAKEDTDAQDTHAAPPAHVDEEAVLVGEFADPGADNGAGAQVHIGEPWSGYRHMKAPEVIDRITAEPEHVIGLVVLYERANRARRTVIAAAERELARRAVQA